MKVRYLIGILALSFSVQVFAGAEGKGGGAGCPQSDGSVITLLECGDYKEPTDPQLPPPPAPPLAIDGPSEIPEGLNELINYIKTFPYLENIPKKILLEAVQPSFYRKYYQTIAAPDLTQTIVDRIKAQFQRVTGLHPNQLLLYGVTDTNASLSHASHAAKVTYLLPAFRNLRTLEEKMTALFHESFWALNPNAEYIDVVKAEMAFEAAMQKPNDTLRAITFAEIITYEVRKIIDRRTEIPQAKQNQLLLKRDMETGALTGFMNARNQITNVQLFGTDAIACYYEFYHPSRSKAQDPNNKEGEVCKIQLMNHIDTLLRTYPHSQFLALLSNFRSGNLNAMQSVLNVLAGNKVVSENGLWMRNKFGKSSLILGENLFEWHIESYGALLDPDRSAEFRGPVKETKTLTLTTDPSNHGPFQLTKSQNAMLERGKADTDF